MYSFVEKLNFVSRGTIMSVIQGDGSGQLTARVRMGCFRVHVVGGAVPVAGGACFVFLRNIYCV